MQWRVVSDKERSIVRLIFISSDSYGSSCGVAVWQPCELLYTCYLLTYLHIWVDQTERQDTEDCKIHKCTFYLFVIFNTHCLYSVFVTVCRSLGLKRKSRSMWPTISAWSSICLQRSVWMVAVLTRCGSTWRANRVEHSESESAISVSVR